MSNSVDFLLGNAFGLLTQCRTHFIREQDKEGLLLIEDEYQSIAKSIEKLFNHKTSSEIPDGL